MKKVRRKILLPSLLIIIVGFGIGGYFLVSVIVRSSLSFSELYANNAYNLIDGIPVFIKGEHISFTFTLEKRGRPKIEWDNFVTNISLYSEEYNFNITISYNSSSILESKDYEEYKLITLSVGPILNTTKGILALNVGRYTIYDVEICYNSKKLSIKEQLDFPFFIINPPIKEQLTNNDFHENFDGWDLKQSLDTLSIEIVDQSPIGAKSLMAYTNQTIRSENSSWFSITQLVDLRKTHFLSFKQQIEGENISVEVRLIIDDKRTDWSVNLDELATKNQLIYFNSSNKISNITIEFTITNANEGMILYLDDFSIESYEHRVFVVVLNDFWEWKGNETIRKNPIKTIEETSCFFEKNLGIKLLPILELKWHPNSTKMDIVDDLALKATKKGLKLEENWEISNGRSKRNNGFDLLACFSNQTSEHYGFAYYRMNVAFHFAQSEELGEYSWLSIIDEWAENLAQHEISHNFGALDRYRPEDPPSVMTKPTTAEQALADFTTNRLWLQLNNWLFEDIKLMIENRGMFD
ncbi:MAG: hypothetical protein ACTSYV_03750 [Candidatus Heimdallarchaeaceae archaeon]